MASYIVGQFGRVGGARAFLIVVIAGGWLGLSAFCQSSSPAARNLRQPVLVELFTSEGCSDCPPADDLLARLDATQFVSGARAIVLSEHVTYWNHLGWRDPFSLDEMTERQEQYESRFALSSSYTPQVVVDGTEQMVGNDTAAVRGAVERAATRGKLEITIADARWEDRSVSFSVRGPAARGATLFAALAEDATHSEVGRGENAGRTLHHVAVARILKDFGSNAMDGRELRLSGSNLAGGKDAGSVRVVVFVADKKTGHILAVAEQTLTR